MDVGLILAVAGLVVAVVALPLTYTMGRRSRQRPNLRYVTDFNVLMDTRQAVARYPLRIIYGSEELDRVSRTYVAIWNHRGDTVSGTDIVASDPLRLRLERGDTALRAGVVTRSRDQCGIRVSLDETDRSAVQIAFDFLDEGDGFILEVVHRGGIAAALAGTVRGATIDNRGEVVLSPKALTRVAGGSWWRRARRRLHWADIGILAALLMLGILLASHNELLHNPQLVPAGNYDLGTLSGQQAFSDEVARFRETSAIVWPLLASLSLALLGVVLRQFRSARQFFPPSIVQQMHVDIDKAKGSADDVTRENLDLK